MPEIRFDNYDAGLDYRRSADTSGANQFRALTNAYISTGKQIKKRPGLLKIATVDSQTKGLKAVNGRLLTFSQFSVIQNANTLILNAVVPLVTLPTQAVAKVHYADSFGGTQGAVAGTYAVIEYVNGVVKHHFFDGGISEIIDANCPHTKSVVKIASKFFAIAGPIVRYSATGLPRNWTAAQDAGFLASGLQQQGATIATWVGEFQKQLVVAFPDALQIWDVDPDPANIILRQRLFNIGSLYPKSPSQVGGDLFFLSDKGFRSVFVSSQTDNLRDSDIGSPIDSLVRPFISPSIDPISVYYADLGQYWCIFGSTAFVYSYSRSAKLSAWSMYVFAFAIDDITNLGGEVYLRAGNNVYLVQQGTFSDDGAPIFIDVLFSFLDFKAPGALKQIHGIDMIMTGDANLSFLLDPRNQSRATSSFLISGNTSPGSLQPVELTTTHIAPRFTNGAADDFSIDSMVFYYDVLGPV